MTMNLSTMQTSPCSWGSGHSSSLRITELDLTLNQTLTRKARQGLQTTSTE